MVQRCNLDGINSHCTKITLPYLKRSTRMAQENQFGKDGWTPERLGDLTGKTYVITGANSGTGYEAAKILLGKGAKVVMLNRSEGRSNEAITKLKSELGSEIDASFILLDLGQLSSVKQAAEKVNTTLPDIDAVICNAAVAQVAKQELTVDGFESQLGINHYGHFLLINLIFAKVKRVVIVGSNGYKMGSKKLQFEDMNSNQNYHPMNTYCHSKLAQMVFGYELQKRVKEASKDVKVYVCHPGSSRTNLINDSANWLTRFLASILMMLPISQPAENGSYPEVMCATEDNLEEKAYYGPTGFSEFTGPVGACKLEDFVLKLDGEQLWKVSETATGSSFDV